MNTIRFTSMIKGQPELEAQQVMVIVLHSGAQVVVRDMIKGVVTWGEINDMEAIADILWNLKVYEFRAVVELLGKVARNLPALKEMAE